MKLVTIVGARPQFVKAAVVSRAIQDYNGRHGTAIDEVIVHTGQHFDANMSDVFFNEMQIPKPQYFLNINGLSHGAMTGQMMQKIEVLLLRESPDYVLVYGDTNSTLAGALTASKLNIPVAHVESGLRSYNRQMPEEINRLLTDNLSTWLFCPSHQSIENLKREGIVDNSTHQVIHSGDVMYDAVKFYKKDMRKPDFSVSEAFVLSTLHRAENTDSKPRLTSIFKALKRIASSIDLVLPLHPRTRKKLEDFQIDTGDIRIVDPVSYHEMLFLLSGCKIVMTDSGGLQKEAYFSHKPCVTLRDETEWVELVEHGYNSVAGTEDSDICDAYEKMRRVRVNTSAIYGNGEAGPKIVHHLLKG